VIHLGATLLLLLLRSMSGVILFDLPMRCIPHRASTHRLVAGQAFGLAGLYACMGEAPAAVLILGGAMALARLVTEPSDADRPSLTLAIVYVLLSTEFVAAAVRLACELAGFAAPDVLLQLWQLVVMWVYTRRLTHFHNDLALARRGGPA